MATPTNRRNFLRRTAIATLGSAAALGGITVSPSLNPKHMALASGESASASVEASPRPSFMVPPEPITDVAETFDADLVVVGSGTSGLVTAVSAQEMGLDVVVISASSKPISRGGSNNAVYSKAMERLGLPRESPEHLRKEIAMNYGSVDQKKWYKFYDNSEEAMNWLIDIMADAGYDCDIENISAISQDDIFYAAPAAHGFVNGDGSAVGTTQPFVVNALANRFQAEGGKIYYKNVGKQLVRGGSPNGTDGRVTGVIAERGDGSFVQYNGVKAVVLATGDFSANKEMMETYCPWLAPYAANGVYDEEPDYDKEIAISGLYYGDGQKMGLWVGAAWQKTYPNCPMGGTIFVPGPAPTNYDGFWGLLLDRNGERFMNEYCNFQYGGRQVFMQEGSKAFAIWDKNHIKVSEKWYAGQGSLSMSPMTDDEVYASWDAMVESKAYVKADTLEELIDSMGLPKERTLSSIERYNELCEKGVDEDFHKRPSALVPIAEGPFYGAVSGDMSFLTVLGGLRTNANMQVCDDNDNAIPGLYNVGTMVGDFYAGLYTFQMEGLNYGAACDCFGFLTGRYIAENE